MSAICSSDYRRSLTRTACARMGVRWGAEDFIIAPSCPRCSAVRGFTNFVGVFIRTILPQNLYPGAYKGLGQAEEGLAVLAEVLATVNKTGERFYEAE